MNLPLNPLKIKKSLDVPYFIYHFKTNIIDLGAKEYEQSLTIVSTSGRPRSLRDRRASLADYAFPELHVKVQKFNYETSVTTSIRSKAQKNHGLDKVS